MNKIFAACLLILLSINTHSSPLPDKPHVYVEGSAEIEVQADTITFSVLLDKVDKDLSLAKNDVESRSLALIKTCIEIGISSDQITSSSISISPEHKFMNGEMVSLGTDVSRQVSIKINDLSKYTEVMSALIKANVSKTVSTTLSVSNADEIKDEVLLKALDDAKNRASRIAEVQGKKLGEPFSISEIPTRSEDRLLWTYSSREIGDEHELYVGAGQIRDSFLPAKLKAKAKVFAVYYLK